MEIWKSVKDNDNYQVSNYGRVRNIKTDRVLSPCDNGNGYHRVDLYRNGIRNKQFVHRLVAHAFHENPLKHPEVNHIDHDRTNNAEDNLEWVTTSENNLKKYSYRKSKMKQ